jgi:hypothetical protein
MTFSAEKPMLGKRHIAYSSSLEMLPAIFHAGKN